MAMTLKEFFIGQKVYAQTSFQKPQLPEEETIEPIQESLETQLNARVKLNQEYKDKYGSFYIAMLDPDSNDGSCNVGKDIKSCNVISIGTLTQTFCPSVKYSEWTKGKDGKRSCVCESGQLTEDKNECLMNTAGNLGIECQPEQLINGTCSRNINKTLGIRSSDTTPNPTILLQDVVLAATSFVGTMIMIALVVMGVKYVKGGYDESSTGDLKGNIKKLLIGLFLIIGSYTIIRLIQYVARGY